MLGAAMDPDRLLEILEGLAMGDQDLVAGLCSGLAQVLGVGGVGVSLIHRGRHDGSLGASAGVADDGEELQVSLGEGPALDACVRRKPVSEPDLARAGLGRWIAFGEAAVAAGIGAVFSFPLAVGSAEVGAMTIYQAEAGSPTDGQRAEWLAVAEVTTRLILALQATADPGALAAELADVTSYQPAIHQATGMVSAQLGVSMAEALVRLQAHAYADGRTLASVSHDVVARRLVLAVE